MYNNKRSVMGKWKRTLIAAALTASMILALPVWNVGRAEAVPTPSTSERLVFKKDGSSIENSNLTITRDEGSVGDLEVDLYLVAKAKPESGYDAYTLELVSPFNSNSGQEGSISKLLEGAMKLEFDENGTPNYPSGVNSLYRELAQDVAKKALELKDGTEINPVTNKPKKELVYQPANGYKYTIRLSETSKFTDIPAGMYLVVPHGSGMTPEQYIRWMNVEDSSIEDAPDYYDESGNMIVTVATSGEYIYSYLPELIALPSKVGAVGGFSTAQTDALWNYDVTANLKSQEERQMASLRINKNFSIPEGEVVDGDDITCGFLVEAKLGTDLVYSNVVYIRYNGEPSGYTDIIEKIPVGATVTVTEEYTGASFTLESIVGDNPFEAVADGLNGEIINQLTFKNTGDGPDIGGDVAINNFKQGPGGWTWTRDPDKQPQQ